MYPWMWYVELAELVCDYEIWDQMSWKGYLNETVTSVSDTEKYTYCNGLDKIIPSGGLVFL